MARKKKVNKAGTFGCLAKILLSFPVPVQEPKTTRSEPLTSSAATASPRRRRQMAVPPSQRPLAVQGAALSRAQVTARTPVRPTITALPPQAPPPPPPPIVSRTLLRPHPSRKPARLRPRHRRLRLFPAARLRRRPNPRVRRQPK